MICLERKFMRDTIINDQTVMIHFHPTLPKLHLEVEGLLTVI